MQLPLPMREVVRLESLRSYGILDTPPEQAFDDLTRLAAYICGTPIALIGFMDLDRQWFKSRIGWDVAEVPRDMSFCAHTILQTDVLVVPDTLEDAQRLGTCPLATHGGIRFYAGALLMSAEGYPLGTLCVMDSVPRGLTDGQTDALRMLARQVMTQLESRRRLTAGPLLKDWPAETPEGRGADGILGSSEALYRTVAETASDAIIVIDEDSKILFVNHSTERIFGYLKDELPGQLLTILMPDYLRQVHRQAIQKYVETGKRHLSWDGVQLPGLHKSGKEISLEISFSEFVRDGKRIFTGICRDTTERERFEHERYQLAAIVESSEDAIIGKDLDGIITSWNKGAERIYGYSAKEVVGKPVTILTPADRADETPPIMERLKRGERIDNYETVRVTKSGERINISLTFSPIRDDNGEIVGASAVGRDITERKRSEERLKVSETRYRRLFETAKDGILILDLKTGQITDVNSFLIDMLGYTHSEFLGKKLWEIGAFKDILASRTAFSDLQTKGVVRYEDLPLETKDGRRVDVEFVSNVYTVDGSQVVQCNIRDITERKQAEGALRRSEEEYRRFFQSNLAGNFVSGPDGKLLACNSAFARMFGFASVEEALKQNLASLYPDSRGREAFVDALRSQRHLEYSELELRRRDGRPVHVIESAIGTFDEHGELTEILGHLIDETERKKAEEQLRQTQKIEAVGQLAGGVAHEFNNFLGVILGYSELMLEEASEDESLRRKIAEIKGATQRAASLTRQLLAFSRQQVLEPRTLDINQAIWETHNLLRRLIPSNVDVVPILAPTIGRIKADSSQVQQVLINLVVNARDAMPQGGKVVIETANVDLDEEYASGYLDVRPGPYVMLSVSDTGCGMDVETRSHIFEPFFTTKEKGKGTGLGLSTVHGIVKQSGGFIAVASTAGKGTTFRVFLPRIEEPVEETDVTPPPIEWVGTETILVVEDETALRRLLCVSLERRGYKVFAAKDGAEAIEVFLQHGDQIHLVVSDIMMPHVDGFELKQRIAALSPDVKFLFMSGYSQEIVEQRQTVLQGCAFLEKPFLPDELAGKVRDLLREEAAA
jgi:two-component system cell cycle sensor histidine kinase/response regulator CckA